MSRASGITLDRVSYTVGGRTILRDFDLALEKGVNRTILGVSGAGKTTILKLILGLIPVDSGRISIDGVEITGLPEAQLREVRRAISVVFQGGALFDSMTVGENVGYRLLERGELGERAIEEIVLEKLGFVGLEDAIDLYPAELSGGMKKRVAIARALAADPAYIFFDEPTTGLDPIGVYNICDLMRRLQQQGKTTLMVTHDLHTAFQVSQRFSFLHEAQLVFDGTKEELLAADLDVLHEFLSPSERSLFASTNTAGADHETKR